MQTRSIHLLRSALPTARRLAPTLFVAAIVAATFTTAAHAQATIVITPPQTIQSGINAANNGDTVLVIGAVYNEDIDFSGKDITVRANTNGFVGATIKGTGSGPVVTINKGETRLAVLQGFEITGGQTSGYGGGISILAASPTIRRCHIHGNTAAGMGGGIGGSVGASQPAPTSPLIEQCLIERNSGTISFGGGGAIAFSGTGGASTGGTSVVRDCILRYNTGVTRGGAIYQSYHNNMEIDRCVIAGNSLTAANTTGISGGGGVYLGLNAKGTITNSSFFFNSAGEGGGLKIFNVGGVSVVNCSFTGNTGGAIVAYNNGGVFHTPTSVTIENTIAWQNGTAELFTVQAGPSVPQITVRNSCLTIGATAGTGVTFGAGMIFADPLFANAAHANLHLRVGSPCTNKGNNAAVNLPTTDLDGAARIASGTVDIGADEYDPIGAILYSNRGPISVASPGTVTLAVETTPNRNGQPCVLVPSLAGIWPGFDLAGMHFPLNLDALSNFYFTLALDATGHATLPIPLAGIGPSAVGLEVFFAGAIFNAGGFDVFTNPISVEFVQ